METTLYLTLGEDDVEADVNYISGSMGNYENPPESPEIEFLSVKIAGVEMVDKLSDDEFEELYNKALMEIEY